MRDITKCLNDTCPVRKRCYRWTSPPSEYQPYAYFNEEGKEKCDYFWNTSEYYWEASSEQKPFNQTDENLQSDAE